MYWEQMTSKIHVSMAVRPDVARDGWERGWHQTHKTQCELLPFTTLVKDPDESLLDHTKSSMSATLTTSANLGKSLFMTNSCTSRSSAQQASSRTIA